MKVLLIELDSKMPNFALHKIAAYHRQKGDEVKWHFPLLSAWADEIYVSCVFTESKYLPVAQWANQHNVFKAMTFDEFLQMPKISAYVRRHGGDKIWAEYNKPISN